MTENLPEVRPSVEDVSAAILSYSDPNLIAGVLNQLGWSCNQEIIETLYMARQNENLSVKLSAIKHLRTLLKEAAEASGLIGNVSRTIPGADGSTMTFSTKRMTTALNPVKKIDSKEIINDETKQEPETKDVDGGSLRESDVGAVSGRDNPEGDERHEGGGYGKESSSGGSGDYIEPARDGDTGHPCIEHRPPTKSRSLYPGISGNPSAGET